MDLAAAKDTVRRLVLGRRTAIDETERDARATALVAILVELPEIAGARVVLAFVPHRSEAPIGAFLAWVLSGERRLLLPYVADDGTMRAAEVGSLEELEPGYRGIPEPRAHQPVDPATADVVVVPGVAFDARGNRLGYGGGFYDIFLGSCPTAPRIGVCFDLQVVDDVPTAEHDLPVDVVVTETRVLRPERRRSSVD